jgi:undecaprenyl-diphosphatase
LGSDKRAAAEFSFFLAMPTMLGAFTYDLWQNRDILDAAALGDIAVGFVTALLAGILVVRWLLDYVSQHGYALFAWWRIGVGSVALLALLAGM